jgi:hypothetical protein
MYWLWITRGSSSVNQGTMWMRILRMDTSRKMLIFLHRVRLSAPSDHRLSSFNARQIVTHSHDCSQRFDNCMLFYEFYQQFMDSSYNQNCRYMNCWFYRSASLYQIWPWATTTYRLTVFCPRTGMTQLGQNEIERPRTWHGLGLALVPDLAQAAIYTMHLGHTFCQLMPALAQCRCAGWYVIGLQGRGRKGRILYNHLT